VGSEAAARDAAVRSRAPPFVVLDVRLLVGVDLLVFIVLIAAFG